MPPNPPLQVDWVILQRFNAIEDAQRWLASTERQTRIEGAAPMLVGRDDVHIVRDDEGGRKPAPVSAVISTRVKPGKEVEYRAWERKIAAAQSKAPGLQGYRFEPPVPGVQEDYVAILRFDSETNLQAWLDSPERKKLVEEAEPLTEEFHARMAHRLRAVVPRRGGRRRPVRLEDGHDRAAAALPHRLPVGGLGRARRSCRTSSTCPGPSTCSSATSSASP